MEWVEITVEGVIKRMPTDVKARHDAWLAQYPDKAGRLAEITANTIREFRDNIKSVPKNHWHEDETYLPQSAVRHCENIIVFTLAMEMGLPIDTAGIGARYAADIFLRQILMGRYTTTTEEGGEGTPRYNAPTRDPAGRALPAFLAVMLAFVQFAAGGWIRPDSGPLDTEVITTATPANYSITSQSLFNHLSGIDAALGPLASTSYVSAAVAAATPSNTVPVYGATLIQGATNQTGSASSLTITAGEAAPYPTGGSGGSLYLSGGRSGQGIYAPVVIQNSELYAPSITAPYGTDFLLSGYMIQDPFVTGGVVTISGGMGNAGGIGGNLYLTGGTNMTGNRSNYGSVFLDGVAIYASTTLIAQSGITLGGETRTNWPQGTILGATINEPHTVATNDGILAFTMASGGTGWTNLSITGTGNAITGATAAADTLTLQRGTIEGGTDTNALLDLAGTRAMTGNLDMGRKSITNVSEFGLSGNRVTLHDDGSGGGKIGITRTAGGGTTERYIGYRRIDVGRFGTYTNVGDVVPSQEFAYLSDFTNYLDLAGTRAMTGPLSAETITNFASVTIWAHDRPLVIGDNEIIYAGQYAWTYSGNGTNVWEGRVNDTEASRIAALAEGAGGGNLIATNTPTAGQMLYASDATKTNLYFADAPSGSGWTNLAFSGAGNAITGATAAADTLTLQRGEIEGGGTVDGVFAPYQIPYAAEGVTLDPTNGWWQLLDIATGTSTLSFAACSTGTAYSVRLDIIGTNALTWNVSNPVVAPTIATEADGTTKVLFDSPIGSDAWGAKRIW